MNNSAENNNLEIFLRNKTGGIHSRKYSISPSYKKKKGKNTTKHKTKTCNHRKRAHRSKQETERFVSNCKQKKPM